MRDWLAHRADATPTATALSVADGPALSYATLDERVEELAGRLSALGVGVGTHLGVCLPTSARFVEVVHAAMRVGAVLVPLNARGTGRELAARAATADCSLLLCGAATEHVVREAADHADEAGRDLPIATVDEPRAETTAVGATDPQTFDLPSWATGRRLLLLFTSGTTGDPKAVDLRLGNVLASAGASAFRLGLDPADRWYVPLPMYHMGGLAPVYRSVLYGTCVALPGPDPDAESGPSGPPSYTVGGFDPERTLAAMRATGATCTSIVPTMLSRLLDAGDLPDTLRFVLLGGAPASEALLARCAEREVPVAPTYGMTEAASQIATARPAEARANQGTVGNPLLCTEITVVDAGSPVDRGERGELVVQGPSVSPGYYNDRQATDEAFGARGLHTGDVGYRDEEGRVWVLNRLDDRIITGGENVDPGEVVAAIREFPDAADAAVVGLPDEEFGERVAALVATEGEALDTDALEAHCRERLAGFKLPRTVELTSELPRTASGTVDRTAVRERLSAGGGDATVDGWN